MKWVWIVLAVVAGTVALAAGIGAMLDPDHSASRRAIIPRPPAEAWARITDFANVPSWRSDLSRIDLEPGTPTTFVEHTDQGKVRMQVEERVDAQRMVVRIADPSLPFSGSWTFELAARDGGTELVITERGSIRNPIFRLLSKLFFDPGATASRYLVDLGQSFGATVEPTAG
ncbi:MAG TPA: SRPBCC family protein [Nannocystaceae bacterium]|nr:SRPBCC family protein [Nannocystaceae bacterium]